MSNIEGQGVTFLENFLYSSELLEPHLLKNDKTMSWDGTIFVFDHKKSKENFFGKVPVQVKSTKVTKFSLDLYSKNFSTTDLNNYFQDGGILIFVIQIDNENNSKIYYSSLLPADLKPILAELNQSNKKSRSIKFEYLPNENVTQIESICKNFVINRYKQISIKDLPPISSTDAKILLISGVRDERPLDQYLLNVPQYLYGRIDAEGLDRFVKKIRIAQIKSKVKKDISIGGQTFFTNYQIVKTNVSEKIVFGNEVIFDINSQALGFKLIGNVEEQLITNKFILKLLKHKKLNISGGRIVLEETFNETKLTEQFSRYYSWLKDIESLLHIFYIDNDKLNLDQVTKPQEQGLRILINSFVYRKDIIENPFTEENNNIIRISIGNLVLGIIFYKTVDGNYKIHNLFDRNLKLQFFIRKDKESYHSSRYINLKCDSLIEMDNFDETAILEDIKSIEYSDVYADLVNLLVLEFIEAYDVTHLAKYISIAEDIIDWLLLNDPTNKIYKLNKFQIIRRSRAFREDEKAELILLKKSNKDDILCGISILLENKGDVGFYLNKLSQEKQIEFKAYPIFTLAKILNLIES